MKLYCSSARHCAKLIWFSAKTEPVTLRPNRDRGLGFYAEIPIIFGTVWAIVIIFNSLPHTYFLYLCIYLHVASSLLFPISSPFICPSVCYACLSLFSLPSVCCPILFAFSTYIHLSVTENSFGYLGSPTT